MFFDPNHFPTPRTLGIKLVSRILINPDDEIIEPSGGTGELAESILELYPWAKLKVVELQTGCVNVLKQKGFHGWQCDFLKFQRKADVFIANPPFRNDFQDIDHFYHAWELLKPGGRIAFILHEYSAFPKWGTGKPGQFVHFLNQIGAQREMNPPGSFANAKRPTKTGTCMVWAYKPIPISVPVPSKKFVFTR